MTAQLLALHERLTSDSSVAFESKGRASTVRTTSAGLDWLADYQRYLALWRQLERAHINPATILHAHFGFILPEEEPDPEDVQDP